MEKCPGKTREMPGCPNIAEQNEGNDFSLIKQLHNNPNATTEDKIIAKSGPYPPPAYVHKLMTKTPQNTFCSNSATKEYSCASFSRNEVNPAVLWTVRLDTFLNGNGCGLWVPAFCFTYINTISNTDHSACHRPWTSHRQKDASVLSLQVPFVEASSCSLKFSLELTLQHQSWAHSFSFTLEWANSPNVLLTVQGRDCHIPLKALHCPMCINSSSKNWTESLLVAVYFRTTWLLGKIP